MNTNILVHQITLPTVHAQLWKEVLDDLGFVAFANKTLDPDRFQILTKGTESDLIAAWGLFLDKFDLIVSPFTKQLECVD